jgi:hypothetical protein
LLPAVAAAFAVISFTAAVQVIVIIIYVII